MSADPFRPIRIAARAEHRRLTRTPRTLAVVSTGKIIRASKADARHVVIGTYDKNVPIRVFVEDAEAAYAELLGEL